MQNLDFLIFFDAVVVLAMKFSTVFKLTLATL
jgi:hypothetical protein